MTAHRPPPGTASLEQIAENLDYAEQRFTLPAGHHIHLDPYEQQHGYQVASDAYGQLAFHQADPTLAMACRLASAYYHLLAARIRFTDRIPTLRPGTEAAVLALPNLCVVCGRPWQQGTAGACPACPELTFGVIPVSAEDAERLGGAAVNQEDSTQEPVSGSSP
jgi:hypothetical protein